METRREEYCGAIIGSSFFVLTPEMYYFRTLLGYCRSLWQKFKYKKSIHCFSRYQQVRSRIQENQSRIQDILAEGSSIAPNAKIIQDNLIHMTVLEILDAVEKFPKFEEITKKYFASHLEELYIGENRPLDRLSSYIRLFGHLIKSIKWTNSEENSENQTQDEIFLKLIAKFCGKSLIKFFVENHYLNFNEYLISQFQVLEELWISEAGTLVIEFGSIPSLKTLSLVRVKLQHFDWLSQNFPKLEYIGFCDVDEKLNDMLIEFQRQNPQLKKIFFNFSDTLSITSSIFKNIGTRTPNLEEIICRFNGDDELEVNTVHLGGLHNLKHLKIYNNFKLFSVQPLIDSLADKQVPIEYLKIIGAHDVMENLPKLKQLKTVKLFSCSEETMINSIKQMSTLEDISVNNLMTATVPGVMQILESIQNSKLRLCIKELSIDSNEYSSMLALVEDRHLKVCICIDDAYIDVDDDILHFNSHRLKISYN